MMNCGSWVNARAGVRQIGSNTPASIACANGVGMAAAKRATGRQTPATMHSAPATTAAPSASENPPCAAAEIASKAAPSVDHDTLIGL